MENVLARPLVLVVALVLCLALVLGGQAAADGMIAESADTGEAISRAGFAYLTGMRVFAAAVLWNRLEPVFHEYYDGVPIGEQLHMLPIIKMVVALDPQFIDSYYVGGWVLSQRGATDEGFALAKLGAENNPTSGTLRTSYAQILFLFDGDLEEAARQADLAVETAEWADEFEQHDSYAVLGAVYRAAGEDEKAAFIAEEIERLDAIIGDALPEGSHDHDGDGVPDH